jgi:hypothetical protein
MQQTSGISLSVHFLHLHYPVIFRANVVTENYGYKQDNLIMLTDDARDPRHTPTRKNIIDAMRWLVQDAKKHDSLFLHCMLTFGMDSCAGLTLMGVMQIPAMADRPQTVMGTRWTGLMKVRAKFLQYFFCLTFQSSYIPA